LAIAESTTDRQKGKEENFLYTPEIKLSSYSNPTIPQSCLAIPCPNGGKKKVTKFLLQTSETANSAFDALL